MLKVAVIGVGSMGKNHARVFSDIKDVELVGVSDTNSEVVENISKKFGCKGYTDYKEMLDIEKPDLVSIVVPTQLHKEVAFEVIGRNIHVLVEKPIAGNVEDGQAIIDLAKEKNVKLMIGHIERFNPAIIELKKRLKNNELGKVFKIDVNRVGPFPARIRDVGVVIDLAVHDLDMLRYITGAEAKRIYAETEKKIHTSNEDLLKALIRLDDNSLCTLSIDWLTPTKIRKIVVTGEKGMFEANYLTQELIFHQNAIVNSSDFNYSQMLTGVTEGAMTKFMIFKKEPLMSELQHFVDCVKNDEDPLVSGDDGLIALDLAQKLIESARDSKVL